MVLNMTFNISIKKKPKNKKNPFFLAKNHASNFGYYSVFMQLCNSHAMQNVK